MKRGKKLLIIAAVAIAAGALLIAVWSYSPPREPPAQIKAPPIVAEPHDEPWEKLEKWLNTLGLSWRTDPPRDLDEIIQEIVSLGVDVVPAVIEGFGCEDEVVGLVAYRALIRIGPSAVPCLIVALEDERASVRLHAAEVLGEFGRAAMEAIPALQKIVRTEQDSRVRKEAEKLLKKLGSGPFYYHQVYVIDRSGSMVDRLHRVKIEVMGSIWRLEENQNYHVVFYGMSPEGGPAERLLPATEENKLKAVGFMRGFRAQGRTDPVPALKQAFGVLGKADPERPGKLMYLVTDGVFPDNEKVLEVIRRLNKDKDVRIHTFLMGERDPVAVRILKRIASETRGYFKHIEDEDLE